MAFHTPISSISRTTAATAVAVRGASIARPVRPGTNSARSVHPGVNNIIRAPLRIGRVLSRGSPIMSRISSAPHSVNSAPRSPLPAPAADGRGVCPLLRRGGFP
ncbi:MAG: hypothetical protein NT045_02975 [Candidatus Aureabacteria bacterium]|nr:hypothetical protein [Candidatus Auribacterota bacterium]